MSRLFLVALAVAGVALAACGGGSRAATGSPAYGQAGRSASSAVSGGTGGGTDLTVRRTALGSILTDGRGFTAYVFEKDNASSTCYDACATYWPPVTTAEQTPAVGSGVDDAKVGTTRRKDGNEQVTYAGHPLYRYAGDTKPGDANGEGLSDFGGEWDALAATGHEVESDG